MRNPAFGKGLSGQGGFTLLEMLIVVGIIGVLAVVAVPRFSNAMILANTSRVQADLQVLNSAIVLYQAEKGAYPTNLVTDLKDYVQNIENVKPPKGTCQLRNGTTVDVTETSYGLSTDRTQATCQSHTLNEFGRKD